MLSTPFKTLKKKFICISIILKKVFHLNSPLISYIIFILYKINIPIQLLIIKHHLFEIKQKISKNNI